jgi:hypothetical protein
MVPEVQLKLAGAARDAANALTKGMDAFDRFVSLLERVEKIIVKKLEEEEKREKARR